jgi:hypothetical protein
VGIIAKSREAIEKQFDKLRQNLLDLTMRNQLLNFRPRTRVIPMEDEIPEELYELLVLNEKKLQFRPREFESLDRSVMDPSPESADETRGPEEEEPSTNPEGELIPTEGEELYPGDEDELNPEEEGDFTADGDQSLLDTEDTREGQDPLQDNEVVTEVVDAEPEFTDQPSPHDDDLEDSPDRIVLKEVYDARGQTLALDVMDLEEDLHLTKEESDLLW